MTTSTTEAEYVAASDAVREALWFGWLAHMFWQVDFDLAPVIYNDSQGVVALLKNPVHHNTSKHIDSRYHFLWDCVILGKIGLEKISTIDNVADGMTKCLSADHFRSLRHQMDETKNRSKFRHLGWFQTTDNGFLRIGFSSSDPSRFGLLSSDLADSNKTNLSNNPVYRCSFGLTLVYAHYGGVSNTSV